MTGRFLPWLVGGLLLCGCEPDPATKPPVKSAKQAVLDSITQVQISVKNGESILLRLKDGYAVLTPRMKNIDDGSYKVVFSASGNFRSDRKAIADGEAVLVDFKVPIRGHRIELTGETASSTWVKLPFNDPKIAAANIGTTKPEELDVSKVKWESNPSTNPADVLRLLQDEGVLPRH